MKNLKNILGVFTLVVALAFSISSCGNKEKKDADKVKQDTEVAAEDLKEMESLIEEQKAGCPYQINEGTTRTKVNYDGKVYEEIIEVPADAVALFKATAEQFRKSTVSDLKKNYSNGYDTLTKLLIDNNITLRTVYVNGDDKFEVEIKASEIK